MLSVRGVTCGVLLIGRSLPATWLAAACPLRTPADAVFVRDGSTGLASRRLCAAVSQRQSMLEPDADFEEGAAGKLQSNILRKWQHMLDISAPHTGPRWMVSVAVVLIYCLRVYLINGACLAPRRPMPASVAQPGRLHPAAAAAPAAPARVQESCLRPGWRLAPVPVHTCLLPYVHDLKGDCRLLD